MALPQSVSQIRAGREEGAMPTQTEMGSSKTSIKITHCIIFSTSRHVWLEKREKHKLGKVVIYIRSKQQLSLRSVLQTHMHANKHLSLINPDNLKKKKKQIL